MAQLGRYSLEATIASGESLSPALDLGEGRAALIQMPSSWTAADLTFQVAAGDDGATFANLYDAEGNEVTVSADASQTIRLPLADWLGIRHLKIRSGTSGTPVNQGAARTLIVRVVG